MPALDQAIDALFGAGGALASLDVRYEPRAQQAAMGRAVAQALEDSQTLVVEAGTGVGKSLGYLLPAALWAIANGRRVLVSTYTRALQEQILEKELPAAKRALGALGHTLRYAMLQGADNYLCVERLARLRDASGLFEASVHGAALAEIAAWSRTAESGHRSQLPRLLPQALWSRLSRQPDMCLGPNGSFWGSCLYRKDRERAERSHVVVVNHALLLSGARLPAFDALIIDEAHSLEDSAIGHFGVRVSGGRVLGLIEEIRGLASHFPSLAAPASRCEHEFPLFLQQTARAHGWSAEGDESGGKLIEAANEFREPECLASLDEEFQRVFAQRSTEDAALEVRLAHTRLSALRGELKFALSGNEEEVARWIEWSAAGISVHAAPLEVGPRLAEGLLGSGIPVVLTSATLSSGRGLRGFKQTLCIEAARELALDSPFDYETQAGLLVQDDLPAPSDDGRYAAALAARCEQIIERVPGGVFILFSSWKTLRAVYERLRSKITQRPLWMQGFSGNDALLADFAAAGNAVLLGVDTFWQGIDVPGQALSCVVLTKLPFPNYGSPVEEARRRWFEAMGRSYFEAHSLPKAIMKFRQGFGRLIRASTDRGAVVVLDSRLTQRGYGAAFLEALPRCRRLESLEDLSSFFQRT